MKVAHCGVDKISKDSRTMTFDCLSVTRSGGTRHQQSDTSSFTQFRQNLHGLEFNGINMFQQNGTASQCEVSD
jgi:hypothetical protein